MRGEVSFLTVENVTFGCICVFVRVLAAAESFRLRAADRT